MSVVKENYWPSHLLDISASFNHFRPSTRAPQTESPYLLESLVEISLLSEAIAFSDSRTQSKDSGRSSAQEPLFQPAVQRLTSK
jgi:hypothetical protein